MLAVVGVKVVVSSPDCQIKSFSEFGLSATLRLAEDPLASATQLVL